MNDSQHGQSSESLFQTWTGSAEVDDDEPDVEAVERLRRSEVETDRLDRQLESAHASWDRERQGLRAEVADLTASVGRLRDQDDKNEELGRSLEEARTYSRQLELQCEEQTSELESRGGALKKRIDELEQQNVELLSRSGNDHRTKHAAEDRFTAELNVHKRKVEIEYEQKLWDGAVHWKKEIRVLAREVERLRKEVVKRPPSLSHRLNSHQR